MHEALNVDEKKLITQFGRKPRVGVWSYEGPKSTSESMLSVPNLDDDARRIHRGLSWLEQKKALCPAGREKYCIFLHLSACVGVTS
jgi:hypothetical protein